MGLKRDRYFPKLKGTLSTRTIIASICDAISAKTTASAKETERFLKLAPSSSSSFSPLQ